MSALKAKARKCLICHALYIPVTNWQKYCSDKCYNKSAYNRYVKIKCPTCDNLTVRWSGRCRNCYMKEKVNNNIKNRMKRLHALIFKKNSCWLWVGATNPSGHGVTNILPPHRIASRASWELHVGCIPPGKLVLHKCSFPNCVNPKHLYIGNHTDNLIDAYQRGERKMKGSGLYARKTRKSSNSTSQ